MNSPDVLRHAEEDLAFCHGHWDYSKDAWLSRNCRQFSHLDKDSVALFGWKSISDGTMQCLQCYHSARNVRHYSARLMKSSSSKRSKFTKVMMKEVQRKYKEQVFCKPERMKCIQAFKSDTYLLRITNIFSVDGVTEVVCDDDTSIRMCRSPSCCEIMMTIQRCDNAPICESCLQVKMNETRTTCRETI